MSDVSPKEMFEALTIKWGQAVEEGRLDDAIVTAISAWFLHRGDRDARRGNAALVLLRSAIDRVLGPTKDESAPTGAETRCSFCSKTQHEVREVVAGGSNAFICDECVALAITAISEKDPAWGEEQLQALARGRPERA